MFTFMKFYWYKYCNKIIFFTMLALDVSLDHTCRLKSGISFFFGILGVERKHFLLTIYYITVNVLKNVTALKFQN